MPWDMPPKNYTQFLGIPDYPNPFSDILKLNTSNTMNFNRALHAEIQALKGCRALKHKPYIAFPNQLHKGIGEGIYLISVLRIVLCHTFGGLI